MAARNLLRDLSSPGREADGNDAAGQLVKKVLIANRGEIACRIIHSCRTLGLKTVAVYSDADATSLHVSHADEAQAIGPAPAKQSYLAGDNILAAAKASGADAVHPGYGFLAENADFAKAVARAGLTWIGPAPESIDDMGDKQRARLLADAADVPILPGSARFAIGDSANLDEAARKVGFPLLVKAAAGGGGIGMRRVDTPQDLAKTVQATQSLADKSFGDGTVYLERLVAKARHVEFQVFGFGDGRAVHAYERECSVQRRFQKIVEERRRPEFRPKCGRPWPMRRCRWSGGSAIAASARSNSSSMPTARRTISSR